MTPEEIGTGVITGGWQYVTAAYVLSWVTFVGYAISLWLRAREEDLS